MKRIFFFIAIVLCVVACSDDEKFGTDSRLRLTFSKDTVSMDTLFSQTPSSTYAFWVYNHNDEGVRLSNVRLARKNQTGFRVNVDGSYLDNAQGSVVSDLEIRRNDSILVFVELTSAESAASDPQLIEDNLVFALESGVEQKVNLRAWSWNAQKMQDVVVQENMEMESAAPIVIYGGITVEEGARLTIRNSTLYFHDGAGIDVHGELVTDNCILRGDRLDRMFDYLPYDRVSGQWKGIRFHETAMTGRMSHTEIRNAENAIVLDSAALDLTQVRLGMGNCVIHNAKGYGLTAVNSSVYMENCQITNTLGDCVSIVGGSVDIIYCTLGQFYPFSADRGAALRFANYSGESNIPLVKLNCEGSILTGYADDVLMGSVRDTTVLFDYRFTNSLLRTPKVMTADSVRFEAIHWESPKDSIQGKSHFKLIDEENLIYDFHLDSLSTAQGLGCYR